MNGRVYDPELGRFLSADPLIQFPESTQGFDRYAYVGCITAATGAFVSLVVSG